MIEKWDVYKLSIYIYNLKALLSIEKEEGNKIYVNYYKFLAFSLKK